MMHIKSIYQIIAGALVLMILLGVAPAASPNTTMPRLVNNQPSVAMPPSVGIDGLPISFEASAQPSRFISRGLNYALSLHSVGADFAFGTKDRAARLSLQFIGANQQSQLQGEQLQTSRSNYLHGQTRKHWRQNVASYARVRGRELYPGIDVVYYGTNQELEYDLMVAPGADAKKIKLAFAGAKQIKIDGEGNLAIMATDQELVLRRPIVYQQTTTTRHEVAARYALDAQKHITFQLGEYDRTQPLIIDPIVTYATYLGGLSEEETTAIAVDGAGNIYVAGSTTSLDFPTFKPLQNTIYNSEYGYPSQEAFIMKFQPDGRTLVYATFLGGNGNDAITDIKVDAAGNAYLAGLTSSKHDFPITPGAIQPTLTESGAAAFALRLSPTGDKILYATFLGRAAEPYVNWLSTPGVIRKSSVDIDARGNAVITGFSPLDAMITPGAYDSGRGVGIAKLDAQGALIYCARIGGREADQPTGIALDGNGNAIIAGITTSPDFPVVNAVQPHMGETRDPSGFIAAHGFIAKLNDAGSALIFATYFSGKYGSTILGVACDPANNICISGGTDTRDFTFTAGAFSYQSPNPWETNSAEFVSKFSPAGEVIFTARGAGGLAIATDRNGDIYTLGGQRFSYPLVNPIQPETNGGRTDLRVMKLSADGTEMRYATFLHASGNQASNGIAIDARGNLFITGSTTSPDFPIVNGYQTQLRLIPDSPQFSRDGFIIKIADTDAQPARVTLEGPQRGENINTEPPYLLKFSGTDADGIAGYIVSLSLDDSMNFRDIARLPADATQAIIQLPPLFGQWRIKVTSVDKLGNSGGAISNYFSASSAFFYAYVPVEVKLKFTPPPAGLAPQNVAIDAREMVNQLDKGRSVFAPAILDGYNIYRLPLPIQGAMPTVAEIIRPENLVGSLPADATEYTDLVAINRQFERPDSNLQRPENYVYAVTGFYAGAEVTNNVTPVYSGLPAIIEPVYREGIFSMQADRSFIQTGAKLIINGSDRFTLKLKKSQGNFVVSASERGSLSGLTLKQLIKKNRYYDLLVQNPDGRRSVVKSFSRSR